jgi:hypothetical protein
VSIEKVKNHHPGRELAALRGGPYGQHWYWADEFAQQQDTARRARERGLPGPCWVKLHYEPTDEMTANHDRELSGVFGRVWRWTE